MIQEQGHSHISHKMQRRPAAATYVTRKEAAVADAVCMALTVVV
jgi:hypothetical protein